MTTEKRRDFTCACGNGDKKYELRSAGKEPVEACSNCAERAPFTTHLRAMKGARIGGPRRKRV